MLGRNTMTVTEDWVASTCPSEMDLPDFNMDCKQNIHMERVENAMEPIE